MLCEMCKERPPERGKDFCVGCRTIRWATAMEDHGTRALVAFGRLQGFADDGGNASFNDVESMARELMVLRTAVNLATRHLEEGHAILNATAEQCSADRQYAAALATLKGTQ